MTFNCSNKYSYIAFNYFIKYSDKFQLFQQILSQLSVIPTNTLIAFNCYTPPPKKTPLIQFSIVLTITLIAFNCSNKYDYSFQLFQQILLYMQLSTALTNTLITFNYSNKYFYSFNYKQKYRYHRNKIRGQCDCIFICYMTEDTTFIPLMNSTIQTEAFQERYWSEF